jgi:2-dehydropantoate 2-reductase
MNICIIGHGAVGLTLFSLIKQAPSNLKVGFYDTRNNYNHNYPFIVKDYSGKELLISDNLFVNDVFFEIADLIVIALKSYDYKYLEKSIFQNLPKKAVILPITNGFTHFDALARYFPNNFIANAVLYISCYRLNGVVHNLSTKPHLVIDSAFNNSIEYEKHVASIVKVFENLGIKVSITDSFIFELWKKLITTASISGSCIYFDCLPELIFIDKMKVSFLKQLIIEGTTVAKEQRIYFSKEDIDNIINDILRMPKECPPSMLFDYRANNNTEFNHINGEIIRLAGKNKVPTPNHKKLIEKCISIH